MFELNSSDAFGQKLLPHHFARAKETVLDSAEGKSGDFDNLLVCQILRMSQT